MKKCTSFLILFISLSLILKAQEQNERDKAIRVFLDCSYCDSDHIKKELTFVNYVRDRKEAQVHILSTFETNGAGGTKQIMYFIGQKEFLGQADTLNFSFTSDATEDEIRTKQLFYLKLGLVRYIAKTSFADRLSISFAENEETKDVTDKWNSWVFEVNGDGYFNGDQNYQYLSLYSSIRSQRVTEKLKVEFNISYNYSENKFNYDDTTIISTSNNKRFNHLLVKSINDHWSYGYSLIFYSSLYQNIDFSTNLYPSIEYNIFPYSKSNRKQLRILYGVGLNQFNYIDSTIYNKKSEFLYGEKLGISLELKEKWGSVSSSLVGTHYFHDITMKRIELNSMVSIRLFKGLSFRLYGGASLINDQLNLPKGDILNEDILLQRKQLASQYEYWVSIGLSYSFGSIYNNVVNPRFGN